MGGSLHPPSFPLILYSALSVGFSLDLALFCNRGVTFVPSLSDLAPDGTATQKTCSLSWETIFQNMVTS